MLDQERIKEMIHMAIFDQNEGADTRPMEQYYRADYVGKEMLKSIITGTAGYGIILFVVFFIQGDALLEQWNKMDLRLSLMQLLISYVVFLGIYLLITYVVYHVRYSKGRLRLKKYYQHIRKVNRLYREQP